MTRIDTAGLHNWLTDNITAANNGRQSWLDDANRISHAAPTVAAEHRRAAQDLADIAAAYRDIDNRLRATAVNQLHQPGNQLDPARLIATGNVEIDLDELHTWILDRADTTSIELRAKTYTIIANRLHGYAVAPDPFPHADGTPGWAIPPYARTGWARGVFEALSRWRTSR